MFWDNFVNLCSQKHVSPNAACAALGLSNATATKWKKGSLPTSTTLKLLSDYFDVPLSAFFEDKKNKTHAQKVDPRREAIAGFVYSLSDEELDRLEKIINAVFENRKE